MKTPFRNLSALMLGAALAATTLLATAGEAEIRKNLPQRIPQMPPIEEVSKTPWPGLYEVRVGGADIFYTDEQGDFLMHGNLLDTKARRNLTEERVAKLTQIDFNKLPVKDAFKIVRGNGKRKLAVFEDPNCGYCKRFEKDMTRVDNVTVYLFLYPVLGPDSNVKSRDIWCSKDRAKAWGDWMQNGTLPTAAPEKCDVAALQRNIEFGRKYNITGTPTLIFADGTRTPGAIPAEQVEKQLSN